MGDKRPLPAQLLLAPIGVDLHLHFELVGEERMEKEIVISLEILNSNALAIEPLKSF